MSGHVEENRSYPGDSQCQRPVTTVQLSKMFCSNLNRLFCALYFSSLIPAAPTSLLQALFYINCRRVFTFSFCMSSNYNYGILNKLISVGIGFLPASDKVWFVEVLCFSDMNRWFCIPSARSAHSSVQ